MADVVIVGAGAAGCVLARRLVDGGLDVCLIEAGGLKVQQSNVDLIGGFTNLWGSQMDWQLKTVGQKGMGGRSITINQGRLVGGSSAINAMMYVRCHKGDYEILERNGGSNWNQKEINRAFSGLENYLDGPAEGRFTSGLMQVRNCPDTASYSPEFQAAAVELGYQGNDFDYNGPEQMGGAGPLQFNIDKFGNRHSAFNAYLKPVLGAPNLTVLTGKQATGLLFKGSSRVVGVETIDKDGHIEKIYASREVIISAGALQSPGLLMKSGIGPEQILKNAGIRVRRALSHVGKGLMDHLQLPIIVRLKKPIPEPTLLTGNVMFLNTNNNSTYGAADMQLNFTPAAPKPLQRFLPNMGGGIMIFLPILVQPKSRGEVTMCQDQSISIDPHYLEQPDDLEVFRKAIEIIRDMIGTAAMSELAEDEIAPGETDLNEYIRMNTSTLWHPVGSCAMGASPEDSVVDGDLRVHGLTGLMVCDASVTPHATSGNNHVPTMVTAEIAASLLLGKT